MYELQAKQYQIKSRFSLYSKIKEIVLGPTPDSLAAETILITTAEFIADYSTDYKHYGLTPHIVTQGFGLEGVRVE
ncbi:MAG: hypothetical protein OFPI_18350 [Osedax symbiont Rs2]|nr:MAG: hypothetical protein OFPI_18350 [Osedax symbiont Rs2]